MNSLMTTGIDQSFIPPLGWWSATGRPVAIEAQAVAEVVEDIARPLLIVQTADGMGLGHGGIGVIGESSPDPSAFPILGVVPALRPENLGDPSFCTDHGLKYPYVSGGMAAGIGSAEIVEAFARSGMLGIFGSAGLPLPRVEEAISRIQKNIPDLPYGFNLIHSPQEPELERGIVDLYLQRGVKLAEASAFLDLTLNVVRYRTHGIQRSANGEIVTPNRLIAKVSRVEVATKFFSPPPARFLSQLVEQGHLTSEQAKLAEQIPMAQDLTAEADSGGHTDNRPAISLFPTLLALRDRLMIQYRYQQPLRVGAAGGISTPASAAAASAMGASYLMVGSVNQACVEAGTCDNVRQMLAEAEQADTAMCPAADMFEMGVKVQVLKRGTMFPMRATKLYELYRAYPRIEAIPATERETLEKTVFKTSLDDVWRQTVQFFQVRDPKQISKAEQDPKHKMALIFRWYLGQSSRWANTGVADRRLDYQIWCGPAMGAFNEWTKGTFLAAPQQRDVVTVAYNLLYGAAVAMRIHALRSQGFPISAEVAQIRPRERHDLERRLGIVRGS